MNEGEKGMETALTLEEAEREEAKIPAEHQTAEMGVYLKEHTASVEQIDAEIRRVGAIREVLEVEANRLQEEADRLSAAASGLDIMQHRLDEEKRMIEHPEDYNL